MYVFTCYRGSNIPYNLTVARVTISSRTCAAIYAEIVYVTSDIVDNVAEWLRRGPAKSIPSGSASSNLVVVVFLLSSERTFRQPPLHDFRYNEGVDAISSIVQWLVYLPHINS